MTIFVKLIVRVYEFCTNCITEWPIDFDQTWFVLYFFITIIKTELRPMWLILTYFIITIVRFISVVILKIMLIAKRIAC